MRETTETIRKWQVDTFGESEGLMSDFIRLTAEVQELGEKILEFEAGRCGADRLVNEAADIAILLAPFLDTWKTDLNSAIDMKMATNRERQWKMIRPGHAQHVSTDPWQR